MKRQIAAKTLTRQREMCNCLGRPGGSGSGVHFWLIRRWTTRRAEVCDHAGYLSRLSCQGRTPIGRGRVWAGGSSRGRERRGSSSLTRVGLAQTSTIEFRVIAGLCIFESCGGIWSMVSWCRMRIGWGL